MYIDKYCATESLSSLVRQHIPAAALLQHNDQQIVYSLPFKDMDKFSGILFSLSWLNRASVLGIGFSLPVLFISLYNSLSWPELAVFLLKLVFKPGILHTNMYDFCFCLFTKSTQLSFVILNT